MTRLIRCGVMQSPLIRAAVLSIAVLSIDILSIDMGGAARADEIPVDIKAGAGADKVEGNCAACHSLDYIRMNSPFLSAAAWDAEVAKMINAFGAPISAADARTIAAYLKANYGK